jgi:hypothetical protein
MAGQSDGKKSNSDMNWKGFGCQGLTMKGEEERRSEVLE